MPSKDVKYLISLRDQFSGKLSHIHKQTQMFDQRVKGLSGTLGKFGGLLAGGFGVYKAFEFLKGSKEAYDALEKAITRVNTVLLSTKGAAGLSAHEIEKQAKELSKSITQGRTEILDAQGMLLSFTGIKGPIFSETTKAVADFATFYKTDMTSSALAIGKAMNNPAQGMNRLQRMGVAFTEKQKETIKHLQAQGDLMGAQRVILKELQTEFGGQAAAFALTDEGKVMMAKKSMNEVKLAIGETISKIQVALIPAFMSITAKLKIFADWINRHKELILSLGKIVLKISLGFVVFKVSILAIRGAMAIATIATNLYRIANIVLQRGLVSAIATISSFRAALASTGIGLFIIGIGLLIGKLMAYKDAQSKANEKLKEWIDLQERTKKETQTFENRQLLNLRQRKDLYDELLETQRQFEDVYNKELKPQITESQLKLGTGELVKFIVGPTKEIEDKYRTAKKQLDDIKHKIDILKKENPGIERFMTGTVEGGDNITKIESAAPKVFNINIQKLVDTFNVNSTTLREGSADIKQKILETLLGAVNDVQITANV